MYAPMQAAEGVVRMFQPAQLPAQTCMTVTGQVAMGAAFHTQQTMQPMQHFQPVHQMQQVMQVQHPAQMPPQPHPQSGMPVIMLEPAYMPQQMPQTVPIVPMVGYMEVPPPPAQPPNLWQQLGA